MLVTREREKLLNALIYFSENVRFPGKTKLYKLLNYLDFFHFNKTGRSVTGLQYEAWEHGPVPKELHEELKKPKKDFTSHLLKSKKKFPAGRTRHVLTAKKRFDDSFFSPFELNLMESLAKKHFNDNATEMSESSHFETGPWHEVYEVQKNRNGKIPYDLVLLRRGNKNDMEILELAKEYQEIKNNYK